MILFFVFQQVVPEWDEYEDVSSGRKFYYNSQTREKSWKPPRKPKGMNDSGLSIGGGGGENSLEEEEEEEEEEDETDKGSSRKVSQTKLEVRKSDHDKAQSFASGSCVVAHPFKVASCSYLRHRDKKRFLFSRNSELFTTSIKRTNEH